MNFARRGCFNVQCYSESVWSGGKKVGLVMNQILMSVLFFMFSALAHNSEKKELKIIDALLETVRVS